MKINNKKQSRKLNTALINMLLVLIILLMNVLVDYSYTSYADKSDSSQEVLQKYTYSFDFGFGQYVLNTDAVGKVLNSYCTGYANTLIDTQATIYDMYNLKKLEYDFPDAIYTTYANSTNEVTMPQPKLDKESIEKCYTLATQFDEGRESIYPFIYNMITQAETLLYLKDSGGAQDKILARPNQAEIIMDEYREDSQAPMLTLPETIETQRVKNYIKIMKYLIESMVDKYGNIKIGDGFLVVKKDGGSGPGDNYINYDGYYYYNPAGFEVPNDDSLDIGCELNIKTFIIHDIASKIFIPYFMSDVKFVNGDTVFDKIFGYNDTESSDERFLSALDLITPSDNTFTAATGIDREDTNNLKRKSEMPKGSIVSVATGIKEYTCELSIDETSNDLIVTVKNNGEKVFEFYYPRLQNYDGTYKINTKSLKFYGVDHDLEIYSSILDRHAGIYTISTEGDNAFQIYQSNNLRTGENYFAIDEDDRVVVLKAIIAGNQLQIAFEIRKEILNFVREVNTIMPYNYTTKYNGNDVKYELIKDDKQEVIHITYQGKDYYVDINKNNFLKRSVNFTSYKGNHFRNIAYDIIPKMKMTKDGEFEEKVGNYRAIFYKNYNVAFKTSVSGMENYYGRTPDASFCHSIGEKSQIEQYSDDDRYELGGNMLFPYVFEFKDTGYYYYVNESTRGGVINPSSYDDAVARMLVDAESSDAEQIFLAIISQPASADGDDDDENVINVSDLEDFNPIVVSIPIKKILLNLDSNVSGLLGKANIGVGRYAYKLSEREDLQPRLYEFINRVFRNYAKPIIMFLILISILMTGMYLIVDNQDIKKAALAKERLKHIFVGTVSFAAALTVLTISQRLIDAVYSNYVNIVNEDLANIEPIIFEKEGILVTAFKDVIELFTSVMVYFREVIFSRLISGSTNKLNLYNVIYNSGYKSNITLYPFDEYEWVRYIQAYRVIGVISAALLGLSIIKVAFGYLLKSESTEEKTEQKDTVKRIVIALIMIIVGPYIVRLVLTLFNFLVALLPVKNLKIVLTFGDVGLLGTIANFLYVSIELKIFFVFVVRKVMITAMLLITPVVFGLWAISNKFRSLSIWMGELFTNGATQLAYALAFFTIVLILGQNQNEYIILLLIISLMKLADFFKDSMQGFFQKASGINETSVAETAVNQTKSFVKGNIYNNVITRKPQQLGRTLAKTSHFVDPYQVSRLGVGLSNSATFFSNISKATTGNLNLDTMTSERTRFDNALKYNLQQAGSSNGMDSSIYYERAQAAKALKNGAAARRFTASGKEQKNLASAFENLGEIIEENKYKDEFEHAQLSDGEKLNESLEEYYRYSERADQLMAALPNNLTEETENMKTSKFKMLEGYIESTLKVMIDGDNIQVNDANMTITLTDNVQSMARYLAIDLDNLDINAPESYDTKNLKSLVKRFESLPKVAAYMKIQEESALGGKYAELAETLGITEELSEDNIEQKIENIATDDSETSNAVINQLTDIVILKSQIESRKRAIEKLNLAESKAMEFSMAEEVIERQKEDTAEATKAKIGKVAAETLKAEPKIDTPVDTSTVDAESKLIEELVEEKISFTDDEINRLTENQRLDLEKIEDLNKNLEELMASTKAKAEEIKETYTGESKAKGKKSESKKEQEKKKLEEAATIARANNSANNGLVRNLIVNIGKSTQAVGISKDIIRK